MKCPSCQSERLRPAPPRNRLEAALRAATKTRYHECKDCGFRVRYKRGQPGAGKPRGSYPFFWAATLGVGVGLLWLLRHLG